MSNDKKIRIGIRREDKSASERRVPLIPADLKELKAKYDFEFFIEESESRAIPASAYTEAGVNVVEELPDCDFIIGIKEIPIGRFYPEKPHLFFSHVIKGQSYNMEMLQHILDNKCTLIDYERIVDEQGFRLIAFGEQAGQAGMVNSIWSLGKRWQVQGFTTPLAELKQAKEYDSLEDIKKHFSEIANKVRNEGMPEELGPIVIGITGHGRVSLGAMEIADYLNPIEITPSQLHQMWKNNELNNNDIYKVVFYPWDIYRLKNEGSLEELSIDVLENPVSEENFDLSNLFSNASDYHALLMPFIPYLSVLVNGLYWLNGYPLLLSKEQVKGLYVNGSNPKLTVIGDVSCDVEGGIECTLKDTYPEDPVYVYNPDKDEAIDGFEGDGMLMMAVTILPAELPRESSSAFSCMLKDYVKELTECDYSVDFDELKLSYPLKTAVIVHKGELTPDYEYIREFL